MQAMKMKLGINGGIMGLAFLMVAAMALSGYAASDEADATPENSSAAIAQDESTTPSSPPPTPAEEAAAVERDRKNTEDSPERSRSNYKKVTRDSSSWTYKKSDKPLPESDSKSKQNELFGVDGSAPIVGTGRADSGDGFFGIGARQAKGIIYVVARTGAMAENFIYVRYELTRAIDMLKPDQKFHVMFYSSGPAVEAPARKLMSATEANKAAAAEFISTVSPEGQVDPSDALDKAFLLEPDVIFLLTDGEFDPEIIKQINRLNKEKKVTVNTISFLKTTGEMACMKIADQNNGKYRHVDSDWIRNIGRENNKKHDDATENEAAAQELPDESKHEEVRFQVISAYSGKPVTNFLTYVGKNKVLTDDKGCFTVRVDPSKKLHIGHSRPQLEPTLEEMRQQVVESQQLRQAIEKDEPLVLLTRKPRIVGRLLSESGAEDDVPEGAVYFTFAWGDRGTSFGRRLLNNTFFVFGDEGVALPEKCTGTVTNLGGNVGEAYMLKEQVKFELTAEAEPLELAVPVIKRATSKLTVSVKNAEDDSPVANAVVRLTMGASGNVNGKTDESGVAVFPDLRMGKCSISVKADHHQQVYGGSLLTRAEERMEFKLTRLFDILVRLAPSNEKRIVGIGTYTEKGIHPSMAEVPPGADSCVVKNVMEGEAVLAIFNDNVKRVRAGDAEQTMVEPPEARSIQLVKVQRDCELEVERQAAISTSITFRGATWDDENHVRFYVMDRATMMPALTLAEQHLKNRYPLPKRDYILFVVDLPPFKGGQRWRKVGELDLTKAEGEKADFVFPVPAEDCREYSYKDVAGNRNFGKQ